jgi:hypothetical protein
MRVILRRSSGEASQRVREPEMRLDCAEINDSRFSLTIFFVDSLHSLHSC